MKKQNSRKYIYISFVVIFVILIGILFTLSYALLTEKIVGEKNYTLKVGNLQVLLDESKTLNSVLINGALPTTDTEGLKNEGYNFSLVNNDTHAMSYTIYIVEEDLGNLTPASAIKLFYTRDYKKIQSLKLLSSLGTTNRKVLEAGSINAGETYNYELKLWISVDAGNEIIGTEFSCHIELEATQSIVNAYYDESGANPPTLADGMIPVKYNGTNWVKALETEAWYDYNNGMWANTVTVNEDKRAAYLDAQSGTSIAMTDINTMWVWIPRYEYKMNQTDVSLIDVTFIHTDEVTSNVENYIIHPAFSFGGKALSGIWISKFEVSSSTSSANNGGDTTSDLNIMVKPNVPSWRNNTVSNMLTLTSNMNAVGNIYGFMSEINNFHLIKNSEWGSVAYLSQSKYGKYGNTSYADDAKEIVPNTSYGYLTGNTSHDTSYSTDEGQAASTTGNIYGVYDMSGGANEIVMANYNDLPSSSELLMDWFTNNPNLYDKFNSTTISNACGSLICFGGALSETSGWNDDTAYFVSDYSPWLLRGGIFYDSIGAGIFSYSASTGSKDVGIGFRIAIKP